MADITEDDTVPPVEAVVEDTVLSEGVEEGKGETSTREESEPEAVQPAEQGIYIFLYHLIKRWCIY